MADISVESGAITLSDADEALLRSYEQKCAIKLVGQVSDGFSGARVYLADIQYFSGGMSKHDGYHYI
ncbi:MAG: hypothetical protein AAF787_23205, partial [Chloroflexota bacterium]